MATNVGEPVLKVAGVGLDLAPVWQRDSLITPVYPLIDCAKAQAAR